MGLESVAMFYLIRLIYLDIHYSPDPDLLLSVHFTGVSSSLSFSRGSSSSNIQLAYRNGCTVSLTLCLLTVGYSYRLLLKLHCNNLCRPVVC